MFDSYSVRLKLMTVTFLILEFLLAIYAIATQGNVGEFLLLGLFVYSFIVAVYSLIVALRLPW